jgi:hypothetical protein
VNLSWFLLHHFTNSFARILACIALHDLRAGGEEVLLEHDAQLFPDALQLLQVLGVLALVLDLGVDACAQKVVSVISFCRFVEFFAALFFLDGAGDDGVAAGMCRDVPSNILTAVGKSLTRLAALRAAMTTLGEGTRS